MGARLAKIATWFRHRVARPDLLVLAALAVVAVAPFGRLFASNRYLFLAAVAAAVALLLSGLVHQRAFVVSLAVSVTGLALYQMFVTFSIGVPVLDDLKAVWNGSTGSWSGLLSTTLPAVSNPELVSLPVILAWAACFGGVELARRTRLSVLATVPAIAAFVVGLMFTGNRPSDGFPLLALLIALGVLLTTLLRADAAPSGAGDTTAQTAVAAEGTRRLAATQLRIGVPVVLVVTAAALGINQLFPIARTEQRYDLRSQYQPPIDVSDAVSPLTRIRAGLEDQNDTTMFRVKFQDVPDNVTIERIRVAALEDYDGAVWSTSSEFSKVGAELPTAPLEVGTGTAGPIKQTVVVEAPYRSSFLPALDRPVSIAGDGLAFDRETGMVVSNGRPRAGLGYTVESRVPIPDEAAYTGAPIGNDAAVSKLSLLPVEPAVPPEIMKYASRADFAADTPYASLKKIEADMRGDSFGYSIQATPGHSYGVLRNFLGAETGTSQAETGRIGTSEQFAAAFAVVARVRGLPSRVIVGYDVDADAVKSGNEFQVKADKIHAWAEVALSGVGWVAFDSTNPTERQPQKPPENATTTTTAPPQSQITPSPVTTEAGQNADACAGANTDAACAASGEAGWPIWPLVVAAVILVPPGLVVGAKRVRRSRRRSRGSPAHRVIGAWSETMDRLRTNGVPTSRAMTAAELAAACEPVAGADTSARISELAPVIDTALYAPSDPPEAMVDAAWDAEAGVADALREQTGRLRRVRAAVDPRPLVGKR